MYDVAIHIQNAEEIPPQTLENLNFGIAYVHSRYTQAQITLRMTFLIASLIVFLAFATKMCCRIPKASEKFILPEQKQIFWLSLLLICLNDPFYLGAVLTPSQLTFFLNQVMIALYLSYLLVFWIHLNVKVGHAKPIMRQEHS